MAAPAGKRGILWSVPPLLVVIILAGAVVLLVLGGVADPLAFPLSTTLLYLGFAVMTVLVVRRVAIEPGPWLSHRTVRRAVVAVALLACAVIAASPPAWLGGSVALLVLLLVLCNVLLGRATEQISVSIPQELDERQSFLRDRSYRHAYWIVATLTGGVVFIAYLATAGSRAWLGAAIDGGPGLVLVALLICLPTMAVAWSEPDRTSPAPAANSAQIRAARIAAAMVAITIVAPIVAAASVVLLPARATPVSRYISRFPPGEQCANFRARAEVGFWFYVVIPLNAEVCWNGKRAREAWGLNRSDCNPSETVLVTVSVASCTRTTEPSGTLHFTYAAWIRPTVLSFLRRRVTVSLTVDSRGEVERGP